MGMSPSSRKVRSMSKDATWTLHQGNVQDVYDEWPTPRLIISDGAYGVGGFPGDPRTAAELLDWYTPHVKAWSRNAHPSTTLWFWNTEVGWATIHPLLIANGWKYEFTNTWNKGIGHIAGNVNGKTIRRFPVVTEVCVVYTREPRITSSVGEIHVKKWLLSEWKRTGLPTKKANEACGVKDAATRKYFDQGWLWYSPPAHVMEMLVSYANEYGNPEGRPYYSIDGKSPVTGMQWEDLRPIWNHEHGVTNVWDEPGVRGAERYKGSMNRSAPRTYKPTQLSSSHLNQKPLKLMKRIVNSCTNFGDVVWDPFGGTCTGAVAAIELGRIAFTAEMNDDFAVLALERLTDTQGQLDFFEIGRESSS